MSIVMENYMSQSHKMIGCAKAVFIVRIFQKNMWVGDYFYTVSILAHIFVYQQT